MIPCRCTVSARTAMNWWKLFKPKACSTKLKAETKPDALGEVVENLVKGGSLATEFTDAAVKALLDREQLASTGVGAGVAIPHVKLEGIEGAVCSLSVHQDGLEWAAVDGAPVQILFTILRPADPGPAHGPEQHRRPAKVESRLGKQWHHEAQQTVGARLQQNRRKNHAARRGRLSVSIRQPGVKDRKSVV